MINPASHIPTCWRAAVSPRPFCLCCTIALPSLLFLALPELLQTHLLPHNNDINDGENGPSVPPSHYLRVIICSPFMVYTA